MRYAIFSDIHGNLQAWNAVLQDIEQLQADVLVCLGDVVGYGPLPDEVLTSIRSVTNNFVLGNHDAAAVGILDPSFFNPHARSVIEWTADQLSHDSQQFLLDTPLTLETEDILFVHAEIEEPGRFGYIENAADASLNFGGGKHFVTFVGHTHHPLIFDLNLDGQVQPLPDVDYRLDPTHRYIINVGSVGEPRNPDDIRGRYVIYDSDTREVYFRQIQFDVDAYRADLAGTSLEVTPYFLQVVDQHLEEVAQTAMTVDMREPAELDYLGKFEVRQARRLNVPRTEGGAAQKPKPMPTSEPGKMSPAVIITILVPVFLVVLGAVAFIWQMQGARTGPESTITEQPAAPNPELATTPPAPEPPIPPIPPKPSPPKPPPPDPDPVVDLKTPAGGMRWDFGAETLSGWKVTAGFSQFGEDGGVRGVLASKGPGNSNRDDAHPIFLIESPVFVFAASASAAAGVELAPGGSARAAIDQLNLNEDNTLNNIEVTQGGNRATYTPGDLIGFDLKSFKGSDSTILVSDGGSLPETGSRAALLDADTAFDTGVINPEKSSEAVELAFDSAVGLVLFFELDPSGEPGDSISVQVSDDGGATWKTAVSFDGYTGFANSFGISTYKSTAGSVNNLSELENNPFSEGGGSTQQPKGLVIDASDFGVPQFTHLRFGGNAVDPVFIAGIAPTAAAGEEAGDTEPDLDTQPEAIAVASGPDDDFNPGEFVLAASFSGGAGNQNDAAPPATPAEVTGWDGGEVSDKGQKGLALFDVGANAYRATFFKTGDGKENTIKLSWEDLEKRGVTAGTVYQLHFFDTDHGQWGWTQLNFAHITGLKPTADQLAAARASNPDHELLKPPPEPRPPPKVVAHWAMNKDSEGGLLVDTRNAHPLRSLAPGRAIGNLAPDPIPLTADENAAAMTLGVWTEQEASGAFDLTKDDSFTFEGWLMTDREKQPIFIGGTRGAEDKGWRLDFKAAPNAAAAGSMRFVFAGAGEPVVVGAAVPLYAPDAHHFAVVWNHEPAPDADAGVLQLFYDGKEVASQQLAHAWLANGSTEARFSLGAPDNPPKVALDEVRFTKGALSVPEFLSLGAKEGQVAFMIDFGKGGDDALYQGYNSPAHAENAIPRNHVNWMPYSAGSEQSRYIRKVRQANGEFYGAPLTIDIGVGSNGTPEVNWAGKPKEDGVTSQKAGSIYDGKLFDNLHHEQSRPIGVRVRGLERGTYTVYTTPLRLPRTIGSQFEFGIGVDRTEEKTLATHNAEGMTVFQYNKTATSDDKEWTPEINYFKHQVRVSGPLDYIVVATAAVNGGTGIPYLQIVKEGTGSVLPRQAPIHYTFYQKELGNVSETPHPGIANAGEIQATGKLGGFKVAGGEGAEVVEVAVSSTDSYLKFPFEVTGSRMNLSGFGMMARASRDDIERRVTLHDEAGEEKANLYPRGSLGLGWRWEPSGTLKGERPLNVPLAPGTYEVRIHLKRGGTGSVKAYLDEIRVHFTGR